VAGGVYVFGIQARQEVSLGHVVHGRRNLSNSEVLDIYGGSVHLSFDYMRKHCKPVHDLFALAEACLLADVIQMAVDCGIPFVPFNLHKDVRQAITAVHVSGDMHDTIAKNPEIYHNPIPHLAGSCPPEHVDCTSPSLSLTLLCLLLAQLDLSGGVTLARRCSC